MPVTSLALGCALAAAMVTLTGCGNERTRPPDAVTPAAPRGRQPVSSPAAGVSFTAPANWRVDEQIEGSRVATVNSSRATVAVWRYQREEPLPHGKHELERARTALLERIMRRDPTFQSASTDVTKVAGKSAIQVLGAETIAGIRVRVRSAHVFADGAEIVVDAYAPPEHFTRLDATVFQPLLRSLRLSRPAPR